MPNTPKTNLKSNTTYGFLPQMARQFAHFMTIRTGKIPRAMGDPWPGRANGARRPSQRNRTSPRDRPLPRTGPQHPSAPKGGQTNRKLKQHTPHFLQGS